jgi:hypothetical protein
MKIDIFGSSAFSKPLHPLAWRAIFLRVAPPTKESVPAGGKKPYLAGKTTAEKCAKSVPNIIKLTQK